MGLVLIGLPHFPAHLAGWFIFLTLCAAPFVVLLLVVELALLLWTKSRWRWLIGVILFGSRVDVYLPLDAEVCVNLEQKTVGNETIIAKLKEK